MAMGITFPSKTMAAMIVFLISLLFSSVKPDFQSFDHPSKKDDGSLSLLVVGDWGRKGFYNQSKVARQMGLIGEKLNVDFIISTGDNFYDNGLTGEDDPTFEESFTNIYTAPSLQKQWYAVLGNHDYRGNALAQLSPFLREKDSKWLCLRSFIVNAEIVDFIFVDTTPFQDKYFSDPDQDYDWRGVLPREKYLDNVLKDLDLALKESSSKWKIVVGHHTIKSASIHGETVELVHKLLPILQANNVDLYINGHDHCLEHIASSESPLQFLTSGGGSKSWRGVYRWTNNPNDMKFYYDGQGFISLEITESEILTVFYDIDGYVLHKFSVVKSLLAAL